MVAGPGRGSAIDLLGVARRAQAEEGLAGGLELERCGILVAERATGASDERACACGLVRRLERLPGTSGVAQRDERPARVPPRERDLATRPGRQRADRLAVLRRGDLAEHVTRSRCRVDVARRHHDLDARR